MTTAGMIGVIVVGVSVGLAGGIEGLRGGGGGCVAALVKAEIGSEVCGRKTEADTKVGSLMAAWEPGI